MEDKPFARVSMKDIVDCTTDATLLQMIPHYNSQHLSDFIKLIPEKEDCAEEILVSFTGVNYAASASDSGSLEKLLDTAKGVFQVVGHLDPLTIINATQSVIKGVKHLYETYEANEEQKIIFHVFPCCHKGKQAYNVKLTIKGVYIITDKGDDDELISLTGYLDVNGESKNFERKSDGSKPGAGDPQDFVVDASISIETDTELLVEAYLREHCKTDGIFGIKAAICAIKIHHIQFGIKTTHSPCKEREKGGEDDGSHQKYRED
jgi:hypothetical protein